MSFTLGEKLRQAREERGISLSEVAEQTRISSLYLESIENDDYRVLPGGIFNKGFVKSFAKYVGIDEQEALMDYSRILAQTESSDDDNLKLYKPEVLTDDRSMSSMVPTIIFAVIILALMTAGILFGVNYLRNRPEPSAANNSNSSVNGNVSSSANSNTSATAAPEMAALKIEFKALTENISLTTAVDGKSNVQTVTAGTSITFEPKESLKLGYSRSLVKAAMLTINGKVITLPAAPINPKRRAIEFEITKDNLAQIWQSGQIDMVGQPTAGDKPAVTAPPQVKPVPKPSVSATPAKTDTPKPTPK